MDWPIGLIRNEKRNWIDGFLNNIGFASSAALLKIGVLALVSIWLLAHFGYHYLRFGFKELGRKSFWAKAARLHHYEVL